MLSTTPSKTSGLEIRATDANGANQPIAHAGCTIRPGQNVSIMLDIYNAGLVADNLDAVREQVNAFFAEMTTQAAELGFPMG